MDLFTSISMLVIGFAILIAGGEFLVKAAISLAVRFKVSPALIGMTIVAAGTSAPELVTSLIASFKGASDIALGNVIGSNTFNILAIVGVSCLIRPNKVGKRMAHFEMLALGLFSLSVLGVGWDQQITRLEGLIYLAVLIIFVLASIRRAKNSKEPIDDEQDLELLKSWHWDGIYLITGSLALMGGAHLALLAGIDLGKMAGLSDRVIGITIISVGTGLPELATSIMAAFRGRNDIAISNVIGSNIMNTLAIVGVTSAINPLTASKNLIFNDSIWMICATLGFIGFVFLGRYTISRLMGGILLTSYLGYVFYLLS